MMQCMKYNKIFLVLITIAFGSCKDDLIQPEVLSNMDRVSAWRGQSYFISGSSAVFEPRSNSVVASNDSLVFIIGSGLMGDQTSYEMWQYFPRESKMKPTYRNVPESVVGAIGFMLKGECYYGLGYAASGFRNSIYVNRFGNWSGIATFPGNARSGSVSFVINNKAYVGLGSSGTFYQDLYEYNPITQSWRKMTNFPGVGRSDACAFVLNGKAYVGTGYDGSHYLNDFYEFNPTTNQWIQIDNLPGVERDDAVAFAFEKRGYVGTGWNNIVGVLSDMYEFNAQTGSWREAPKFSNTGRLAAVAFTYNGKAYVGTGNNAVDLKDFWVSK